jgi:anti-anti-sigma factor
MEQAKLDVAVIPNAREGSVIKRLTGKLALETVHGFIAEQRKDDTSQLILDLSGVNFMDSAGVGALVQLFVHRRNAGKTLALTGLPVQSKAVLQVSGLTKLLPIFDSAEAASAASTSA